MNNIVANTNFILHQINTVVGDIEGNTRRIIDSITTDNTVHIFPECAVTGYLCGNLFNRLDFVKEADNANVKIFNALNKKTELRNIIVIFGNITFHGISKDNFPKLKNSAIVINKYTDELDHYAKIQKFSPYHKQLLANSGHHEDRKYFKAGKESSIFEVTLRGKSFKIGVPICEDAWFKDHKRNINLEMSKLGADILISINQSFFSYGKQVAKMKMVSEIAQQTNLPVIYLNNVGCGDVVKNIVTYNGGSMVFNDNGKLLKHLPIFEEVHEPFYFQTRNEVKNLNFDKYHEILMCLIYGTKEFAKLSHVANLQVHVSGGLDSAIVSYITAKAMGKSNTIFISNPSSFNGDETKSNAQYIADKLGIKLYWNPIEEIYNTFKRVDTESFADSGLSLPLVGDSCIQAVLRSVQGLTACHRFKSAIMACGNHTEIALGWASFHDIGSIGLCQIIGDLTKVECFELAAYINKIENDIIIPESLYNDTARPAAELPDANEDGIDYWVVSGICAEIIRNIKGTDELLFEYDNKLLDSDLFPKMDLVYKYSREDFELLVDKCVRLIKRSMFKMSQSAPIFVVAKRSRGFSNRETLSNNYSK